MTTRSAHQPRQGIALAFSGGGYRAMLYHLGALRRVAELGLLTEVERVSSVSGGSILAGTLATRWNDLNLRQPNQSVDIEAVERPIIELSQRTIDVPSVLVGLLPGTSVAKRLSHHYDKYLFGGASLQDVPQYPRFTFNTTNMTNGNLMRWTRDYAADHALGRIDNPQIPLSVIVAASSAFPPFLAPTRIRPPGIVLNHGSGQPLEHQPRLLWLADGGVYDNLGLQTLESYPALLVSDGGAPLADVTLRRNWISQSLRTTFVIDAQVRRLRKRMLGEQLRTQTKSGALWTISTPLSSYPTCFAATSSEATEGLAHIQTRLKRLPAQTIVALLDWGYVSADAAIRSYYMPDAAGPVCTPRWPI